MKGVRCSWVDMDKIRQALACAERGDQKRLSDMRCVQDSTVSMWRSMLMVADAIEGKVQISELSSAQPSHAYEIARAYRKAHGKEWSPEVKEQIAAWVDTCEAEEWTVQELRQELHKQFPGEPEPFDPLKESERIYAWLEDQRESYPDYFRDRLPGLLCSIAKRFEAIQKLEHGDQGDRPCDIS